MDLSSCKPKHGGRRCIQAIIEARYRRRSTSRAGGHKFVFEFMCQIITLKSAWKDIVMADTAALEYDETTVFQTENNRKLRDDSGEIYGET